MEFIKRYYSDILHEYLKYFPCAALIGVRQCGKTTLLNTLPDDWRIFDLEKQSDFQAASHDPDLFFRLYPEKVAIDEAQLLPGLFPALRVAIDNDREARGRFVLTGSSSPALLKSVSESLAGRLAVIEMAPLSFAETRGNRAPEALRRMTDPDATAADFLDLPAAADPADVHQYWLFGGYPEPWFKKDARFHELWMNQYVGAYLYRDVARLFPGLDEPKYRRFVQLLAGLSGTLINYSDAARALGVSQPTARDYFDIAHGTFLWRSIPAYEKNVMKRVVKRPRGYLRDSGLMHHLLRIPNQEALLAHPAMGRSWEGMVIEEILRGMAALGAGYDCYHYRTAGGAEIDLILEGGFGRIPIEIKYGQTVHPGRLRAMKDFIAEQGCRLGVVINNDEKARLYADNILGFPFARLAG